MTKTLTDAVRSKAIVSDAWETIKRRYNASPTWPYMGVVSIVDRLLTERPSLDGRDLADAIVLCRELGEATTASTIRHNLDRVAKGHGRNGSYT